MPKLILLTSCALLLSQPFHAGASCEDILNKGLSLLVRRMTGPQIQAMREAMQIDGRPVFEAAAQAMRIDVEGTDGRLRIPESGPVVVVANHPNGITDAVLLALLMEPVRPDLRIVAAQKIEPFVRSQVPEMVSYFVFVDINESRVSMSKNALAMKEMMNHLKLGGALVIFPAGEVSSMYGGVLADRPWNPLFAKIADRAKAPILPVHVGDLAGWFLRWARRRPPSEKNLNHEGRVPVRDLAMLHDLSRRQPRAVRLTVGELIEAGGKPLDAGDLQSIVGDLGR